MKRSTEEVLHCLTSGGATPIEYCFLWYGCVNSWDPVQGAVLMHRIEENELFAACQEYLRNRRADLSELGDDKTIDGRYQRLEALARYAAQHQWPNPRALKAWIDGWKSYYAGCGRWDEDLFAFTQPSTC
jgi:hypothetical protein